MVARAISVGLVLGVSAASCAGFGGSKGAGTSTTAASLGAPSRKTVDSTGYVDNAGETSDARQETPRRGAGTRERAAAANSYVSAPVGAPGYAVVSRFARARCDRELACERIGPGLSHGSDEACIQNMRPEAYADVEEAGCGGGFEASALGACLLTIRQFPCDAGRLASLDVIEACRSSALCAGE